MVKVNLKSVSRENGFTMMELMIVIVIIGLLLAIAAPAYQKLQDGMRARIGDSNARMLNRSVASWVALEYGQSSTVNGSTITVPVFRADYSHRTHFCHLLAWLDLTEIEYVKLNASDAGGDPPVDQWYTADPRINVVLRP